MVTLAEDSVTILSEETVYRPLDKLLLHDKLDSDPDKKPVNIGLIVISFG